MVDTPPAPPESAADHRISGRTADCRERFSLRFSMPEVAGGAVGSGFAFVLPMGSGWENALAGITLSRPGGSVELDGEGDRSVTVLRDPRTGRVRGVLRNLPDAVLTGDDAIAALSGAGGLEVLFSRGVPGAEASLR